ncbi:DUF5677 domain-containing protein [Streptomyces sp. NPDC007157]|uniref:DUF5677 domain-containing protein n=1 Tax=Streptomyces sp. NPDC007157 TaxID=3154681 RepID=UPI0033DF37F7
MATSEERPDTAALDTRLQPLFDIVGDVAIAAERSAAQVADSDSFHTAFDGRVLQRGIKGLKAARLLIGEGYWEHAAAVTRQLFELLVNMEHLASFPDRGTAISKYNAFGLLQYFLSEVRRMDYEKERGRPEGTRWEASVRDTLDKHYDDFKLPPKADGTTRWRSSWSGKTTRDLAESSPDSMRIRQYVLLFTTWSEQAHAAPGVFAADLFVQYEEEVIAEAFAEIKEELNVSLDLIAGVAKREAQTLYMAIIHFMQLWQQLPKVSAPKREVDLWLRNAGAFMAQRVSGPSLPI